MSPASLAGPVILICIGLLFLANNFGVHWPIGELVYDFWPVFLMAAGLFQIARALATGFGQSHGRLTGGAVITLIGFLFLVDHLFGIGFDRTWPLILILIGALGVLRFSGTRMAGSGRVWR